MKKETGELLNELKKSPTLTEYWNNNSDQLYNMELKDCLSQLLEKKHLTKAEAIANSGLYQVYGYQIFSGRKSPSRDKLLALCFGMGLDLEDTQQVLKVAGLAPLYPRIRRDCIIIFAINQGMTILQCGELLFEAQERPMA